MPEEDALPSERGGQGPATEAQLCSAPQEGANGDDGISKREINPHPLKSNTTGDTSMNLILEIGKKDTTEPGLECQRDHPDPQCPHRSGEVLGESLDEGVPEKQGQISASMPQESPEELQDRCLTETERHLKGLLPLKEMWSWKRKRTVPEIRVRGMTLEGAEADFTSLHHECQTSELEQSVSEMQDRNRQNTDKSPESSTKSSPEQEFQRASAVRVNISDVTVSAPEIEKDLPLDLENSNWEIMQFGSPEYQNTVNTGSRLLSARYPVGCKESHTLINKAVQDSVWYKAQIGQQAKCLLTVNSNPETIPSSDDTGVKNNQSVSLQACTEVEKNEREYQLINQPAYTTESSLIEITAPVKEIATDNLSKDSLPLAADSGKADSRGFGDEPLENYGKLTYPLSCEGQKSTEKDHLPEKILGSMMSLAAEDQKSSKVLDDAKAKIHTTSQSNKTGILETCPEFCSANLEVQMLHKEKHITQKAEAFTALKVLAYEETLSEILSPVDEVLSYGSAELPSIAGAPKFWYTEASLTPPPSTDNITMTSEDDFPPPPAEIVQLQVGNNSTEDDRSIKSEDLPSLSEDLSVPVVVCDASEKKAIPCVGETAGSTERETMRVNSAKIKGHFLLDKDEVSSSLNNNKILSEEQNNNEDQKSKLFVSVSAEDDSDESSDPLSSFEIGHRVLVCHTKPGVLKYKGPTSFSAGYWAGVALDSPNGHHNGTFRGVQYFECAKNCGVLVRAEDISHPLGEQDSDLDTKADDDPFSDDEPPKNLKSNQERSKCTTLSEKTSDGNTDRNQYHGMDGSTAPKMYSNSLYMVEMRKTHLQMSADLIEEESIYEASTCSVSKSSLIEINPLQQVIYEAARAVEEFAQSNSPLEHGPGLDNVDQTTKAVCDPSLFSAKTPTERCGNKGPCDDWIDTNLIQSDSHEIPMMGLSKLRDSERGLAVFLPQHTKNVESTNGRDLDLLVDRLAENLVNEAVRDALEIKKMQDTSDNLKDNPSSKDPGSIVLGKIEENQKRINQLCFRDVWSCAISPEPVLESSVPPHSPEIVLSLVGAAVEQLWNHREGPGLKKYQVPDMGRVPPHLVNEESRRAYRQVIFDLTSDLFHSAFKSDQVPSYPFPGKGGSPFSAVLYAKTSLSDIKGFIQCEVQRQLNLGRSEQQMKRLLQTGSTYGKVQRDMVDCILIQELREEEPKWLDYSSDELSVKMKLTEEIFDALLQDTIHILDHIYTGPLGVTSPEPFQPE
uniref:Uncharacterized LOC107079851 n=1 Tax=Lepisosteus oculatus TaxID=7918 RepID=W5M880_LEPOC|nr:PREDICTED: uncharacterized protein LOC107079851 [Lepisosteus oculatus]